jgi:hypothetical protein
MKMATFWTTIRKILSESIYPENVTLNEKIIKELEKYRRSKKEVYYEDKYPKIDILYAGRSLPNKGSGVKIDIRDFFNTKDSMIKSIVTTLKLENKTDDEKAVICLEWIIKNIKYVSDTTKGLNEFWQFPYETLTYMTGDCEDMSILLANMLIISGIPSWKIRLSAGNVDDKKGSSGGHCFPTYYCEEKDQWVLLDCCYWPNTSPIDERKAYKDETYYISTWFSWSEEYCWAKDVKDIPNFNSVQIK